MIPPTLMIILTAISAAGTLLAAIFMFCVMKVQWATKDKRLRGFQWLYMMHLVIASMAGVRTILAIYYFGEVLTCASMSPVLSRLLSAAAVVPYYLYAKSKQQQHGTYNQRHKSTNAI